ncbi:UDP-glucosyltransferase 85K17 [Senna tora]|uniref:Glycosyltransferase n=1 Tax=Senna tora TaxID=362788 RepID=A0A834T589_9FABA|nr:UDP-glucosyltransferase 85K17 [Senna tora]
MDLMGDHENYTQKPHVVCIPYPAQGHINPFMQLAKLLHSNGFHITFVNTEFNHRRFAKALGPGFVMGLPDFRFETIPDGMPSSDKDATQDIPALCESTRKHCFVPFKELIVKLNSSTKHEKVPPVSCIICDPTMGFAAKVADELGIQRIQLWTASACGMLGYLQYDELVKRGIVPFKDESFAVDGTLDTILDWVTGMKDIKLKYLPSFIRVTNLEDDIMFDFIGSATKSCINPSSSSNTVIINTFKELDIEVLDVIMAKNPNVYTIGPLHLLNHNHFPNDHHHHEKQNNGKFKSSGSSLWKSDSKCIQWLEKWEPNSVIYVNYGSITMMSEQHLKEFAWGLADSKHPFLWILRPDLVMGESEKSILPQDLLDEVKDRGYITSWCTQEEVLGHPSIGAFLTHCGWNSTLESICNGVPVICWPFFAEQQTNCWCACTRWEIGMEIKEDVKREEICGIVKEALEGEKGKEMRRKSLEWKKKAMEAIDKGGSSYNNFKRLLIERFSIIIDG